MLTVRDILPDFVTADGAAFVLLSACGSTDPDPTSTEQGVLIGTPHYMSPEQIRGQEVTFTADVDALGIMLYEMLNGAVPFNGDSALAVAMQHLNEAPEPIERILPDSRCAAAIDNLLTVMCYCFNSDSARLNAS